jgi:hypothetical protein
MKNKLLISALILLSFFSAVFYGCKDECATDPLNPDLIKRVEKLGLNDHNKNLLFDFFTAKLSDTKGARIPVACFVWNNMLRFETKADVKSYLLALEVLQGKWDYNNKIRSEKTDLSIRNDSDGFFETTENIGNDALNAVEFAIGFQSLRRHYDLLADNDSENWRNGIDYIADPELQSVFSAAQNIMVESEIYHFLNEGLIAIVHNQDLSALANVEQNGISTISANLDFYDENADEYIEGDLYQGPPPPGGPLGCALDITTLRKTQPSSNDPRTINIERKVFELSRLDTAVVCTLIRTVVKWGDGSESEISAGSSSVNHTYIFDPAMLTEAGKPYVITVEATLLGGCGGCTGGTKATRTLNIIVRVPPAACFVNGSVDTSKQFYLTIDGVPRIYKIDLEHGQRGEQGGIFSGFASPKVWSKARFSRYKNGRFSSFCPSQSLGTITRGSGYTNDCISPIPFAPSNVRKDDCVETMKWDFNQDFGIRKDGPTRPLANGTVHFTNGLTNSLDDFPIWK